MKTREVTFYSRGTKIVGTMYLPDDYTPGEKLPCIIPCSGYTGINAAYPKLLSQLFTKHGYVCLGFDYRGWAPSEGTPGHTTAEEEYDDILSAYIFAQQQPEVQSENIGLFGWGFSAPTVLKIAADWPEIKAVGCGNGVYNGKRCLRTILSWPDYQKFDEIVRADLVQRVTTGEGVMLPPYQHMGATRSRCYSNGQWAPLTMDWLTATPHVEAIRTETDTVKKKENFLDIDGVREAIIENYGTMANFPPKHGFEPHESYMRIDSSYDVQKISPRPIFLVHSKGDQTYPISEAECLAAEIGSTCTTCYVEGTHNGFMFEDNPEFAKFSKSVINFYDKALKN